MASAALPQLLTGDAAALVHAHLGAQQAQHAHLGGQQAQHIPALFTAADVQQMYLQLSRQMQMLQSATMQLLVRCCANALLSKWY